MFDRLFGKKPPTLERQLHDLVECGVRLLPGANREALLREWSQEEFENDPYELALVALAGDDPPLAENVWHFDTECIEDHGDYARIAERMRSMAGNALPIASIQDFVDVEAREAWLSFVLDGSEHRWTCEVQDDWVDPTVLSRFAALLARRNTGYRFAYLDLGGQDCMLGCFRDDELRRLRRTTGLAWEWLQ
jgi:hypothetical protein